MSLEACSYLRVAFRLRATAACLLPFPSYFRVSVDEVARVLSPLVPYLRFYQNLWKRLPTVTGATPGKLVSLDRQKGCLTRAKLSIN